MKLSVLVTFYNQEKCVDRALNSIISQKVNFDYEILIGDDGSSDNTCAYVKKWQDKYPGRIKLYIMNRDLKKVYNSISRASRNRLNLLEKAKGKYLLFLDGDDFYIDNNKFQRQVDILDLPENQECVCCGHNVNYYFQENGKLQPMNDVNLGQRKISSQEYWAFYYICSTSLMFRNITINKQLDFKFSKDNFDDNLITFCFIKYGSIYYIPDIMANYTQSGNSIWNQKTLIEQNIINLLDFDCELLINPLYKNISLVRHWSNFQYLYKNRAILKNKTFDAYRIQAFEINAFETIKWFTYKENTTVRKIIIILDYLKKKIQYTFLYLYYRIK